MKNKFSVLAVCGSTRADSSNHRLIKAIAELMNDELEITIFDSIASLPHFNPDLDTETPPDAVANFRHSLKQSDGILICTPEYAMGLPGSLKNAIDWTVSSMEFSGKPTVAITASTSGEKAHTSLLGTLKVIEADCDEYTQLLIPFIKTKLSAENKIIDPNTEYTVLHMMHAFIKKIQKSKIQP